MKTYMPKKTVRAHFTAGELYSLMNVIEDKRLSKHITRSEDEKLAELYVKIERIADQTHMKNEFVEMTVKPKLED